MAWKNEFFCFSMESDNFSHGYAGRYARLTASLSSALGHVFLDFRRRLTQVNTVAALTFAKAQQNRHEGGTELNLYPLVGIKFLEFSCMSTKPEQEGKFSGS